MMGLDTRSMTSIRMLSSFCGSSKDRRADTRYQAATRAFVSWRVGDSNYSISVRLINISKGGAAVKVDGVIPTSSFVRVRLAEPEPVDWIDADVLEVISTDGAKTRIRLKFRRRCAQSFVEYCYARSKTSLRAKAQLVCRGGVPGRAPAPVHGGHQTENRRSGPYRSNYIQFRCQATLIMTPSDVH